MPVPIPASKEFREKKFSETTWPILQKFWSATSFPFADPLTSLRTFLTSLNDEQTFLNSECSFLDYGYYHIMMDYVVREEFSLASNFWLWDRMLTSAFMKHDDSNTPGQLDFPKIANLACPVAKTSLSLTISRSPLHLQKARKVLSTTSTFIPSDWTPVDGDFLLCPIYTNVRRKRIYLLYNINSRHEKRSQQIRF